MALPLNRTIRYAVEIWLIWPSMVIGVQGSHILDFVLTAARLLTRSFPILIFDEMPQSRPNIGKLTVQCGQAHQGVATGTVTRVTRPVNSASGD
jgi:hypothetical protein